MPSYIPPKKNTAFRFYVSLTSQADTKSFQSNPTLASGDVKVSIDGGAFANITTLPSASPASSKVLQVDLSTSEMNGDNIVVLFSDAAGAEWCDLNISIQTSTNQIDDLTAFAARAASGNFTFQQLVELMSYVLLGKVSGMESNAPVFRNLGDSANGVSATTDANGNRSSVTRVP